MKAIRGYRESIRELRKVTSCASGTDKFIAQTIPLLIRQNNEIIELLHKIARQAPKPHRRQSEWQRYATEGLRKGYNLKSIAELWRTEKPWENLV